MKLGIEVIEGYWEGNFGTRQACAHFSSLKFSYWKNDYPNPSFSDFRPIAGWT